MRQNLIPPVVARWFRVHPVTWEGHCSLRLELIGCQNRLHGKLSNNDSAYTVCMYNIKQWRTLHEILGGASARSLVRVICPSHGRGNQGHVPTRKF